MTLPVLFTVALLLLEMIECAIGMQNRWGCGIPHIRVHGHSLLTPQMQKVIVPKQLKEISRVLFGNLPANSLVRTGLKAYNKKPIANQIGLANPRSIQEILRAPLSFPTDDLILNGYTPYQWMRYSEMVAEPFAKKQAGLMVDEEELFYYRHAKTRRMVKGQVAANYKTDADDYWEKKARRKRFQGKGPPKKGENAKKGK